MLLAEGRRAITIGSTVPFRIRDATGKTYRLPSGPLTLRPTSSSRLPRKVPRSSSRTRCRRCSSFPGRRQHPSRSTAGCIAEARGRRAGRVPAGGRTSSASRATSKGSSPGEMPFSWPTEALKAQSVAARSYALANLVKGKPFDLYAGRAEPGLLGGAGEKPTTTEAVRATAGEVVLYGGKVASTLYFSTSGGKTASAADVFGTSIPYLVSRPDPWDKGSPYFRWGPLLFGARTVQSKLGADARVIDARAIATPSGRIRSLVARDHGRVRVGSCLAGSHDARSALDVDDRSASFGSTGRPPGRSCSARRSAERDGRGLDPAAVATSADGGVVGGGHVPSPEANGSVLLDAKPIARRATGSRSTARPHRRCSCKSLHGVQLARAPEPDVLTGTVRPKLSGAVVSSSGRRAASWIPVRQGTVRRAPVLSESSSRWRRGAIEPVSRRRAGLVAGVSPTLVVTG